MADRSTKRWSRPWAVCAAMISGSWCPAFPRRRTRRLLPCASVGRGCLRIGDNRRFAAISFASASNGSAIPPSRAMRWLLAKHGFTVDRREFPPGKYPERTGCDQLISTAISPRLLVSGRTSCSLSETPAAISRGALPRCRESLVPRSVLDALFGRHPNLLHRKRCVATKERAFY